jgi:phosphotransferase system  glucose/maltose/N-acetylglucosamine-specific IIC component
MSTQTHEPSVRDRIEQRPAFSLAKVKETSGRELAIRFAAGALTSIGSGAVTLAFGARVGGILLGFPAIMAASLTLIAEEEDVTEAREDARGAIVGACALTLFAAVAALSFGHLAGGVALLAATVVWVVVAVLGYVILWWR